MARIECGKGYRYDENGWTYLNIKGSPLERGYQHGALMARELASILKSLRYLTYFNTGKTWDFFVDVAQVLHASRTDPEFIDEMKGIAIGASEHGTPMSWEEVLAWNGYEELTDYWWPNAIDQFRYFNTIHYPDIDGKMTQVKNDHCSAFIAHAGATEGGKVVMAHNSFNNFEMGQFSNLVLSIDPSSGHNIVMQSAPGYIESFADFFITDAGIMGTETTIGGFSLYDSTKEPEYSRIRKAMQYGDNLDDYVRIMSSKNNGGYANSWLLADVNTKDIMRFELGLKYSNIEMNPKSGYFIGFNAPIDPRIRNLECSNTGFADIRRHQGARQVRLNQLMREHLGKINTEIAKTVLADHYDVYTGKDNPCSRTVDGHYELDDRAYMSEIGRPLPFQPRGAVDGKVADSEGALKMTFEGIWGNSSGMDFDVGKFLREHPQWEYLTGYLYSRHPQPWTSFVG